LLTKIVLMAAEKTTNAKVMARYVQGPIFQENKFVILSLCG
jgi:hypothetical protein